MNRTGKSLAATFLSAAMLFSGVAQAMEIRQFDKMADQDQAKYRGDLVVGRAGSRDPSRGLWVDGRQTLPWDYFPLARDSGTGDRRTT